MLWLGRQSLEQAARERCPATGRDWLEEDLAVWSHTVLAGCNHFLPQNQLLMQASIDIGWAAPYSDGTTNVLPYLGG